MAFLSQTEVSNFSSKSEITVRPRKKLGESVNTIFREGWERKKFTPFSHLGVRGPQIFTL